MRIAFTAKGGSWEDQMDPRFGRAEYLSVYSEESEDFEVFDNRSISGVAHGAGPMTAKHLFDMKPDVLITGNGPGGNAGTVLQSGNVRIFIGAQGMTLKEAYDAYKAGALKEA